MEIRPEVSFEFDKLGLREEMRLECQVWVIRSESASESDRLQPRVTTCSVPS